MQSHIFPTLPDHKFVHGTHRLVLSRLQKSKARFMLSETRAPQHPLVYTSFGVTPPFLLEKKIEQLNPPKTAIHRFSKKISEQAL
jgi:hypothetical protein